MPSIVSDKSQIEKAEEAKKSFLVKDPSLSTIQEEGTSDIYDTPMASIEEREISFSFDGKEVSVSLYETPDLTEEEAIKVVEMYADELSEHISGKFIFILFLYSGFCFFNFRYILFTVTVIHGFRIYITPTIQLSV